MTDKEFIAYVNEQKRQGVSDNQIARKLGMNLAHFLGKLNGAEKHAEAPKEAPADKKPAKAPVKEDKPVKAVEEPAKTPAFFADDDFAD